MVADDPRQTLPPADGPPAGDGPGLGRGASLGRYLILDELGSGGMGVVFSAYDAGLDRKVAVKLLKPETTGEDLALRQDRLMREARAMAKLSNPNVNTVFDVGTFEGQLFVAMELVDGQTMTGWLAERRRTWREVVAAFLQAGRGLAAAHRAGLIHRDVKPDNLLVGTDGRVRVTDFGLVSSGAGAHQVPPDEDGTGAAAPADDSLTMTGAVFGSPAYMSPEQHEGRPVTPASDQFSFCVALFEALYGTRPYDGDTQPEIASNIREGQLRSPEQLPADRSVGVADAPAFLQQVLLRGLAADPDRRYPDMEALLADLARDPARTRRRVLAWAGAAFALVAGVLGLIVGLSSGAPMCDAPERHLAGVWDQATRAQVKTAFENTGLPQAPAVFAEVSRRLSAYSADWVDQRRQACEATHVHGEQSAELMDLRMNCLDRRLTQLDALVRVLAGADDEVLNRAVTATGQLGALSDCADTRSLRSVVARPSDPATLALVERVEQGNARAQALLAAGQYEQAQAAASAAAQLADRTGHRPIQADALLTLGRVQQANGELEASERSLRKALAAATAGGHDRAAAQAWIQLVEVVGDSKGRYEEGQQLAELASASLERLGGDRALEASLAINKGAVLGQEQRYDEAAEAYQRAVDLKRELFGPEHLELASALAAQATNLRHQRQYARAEQVQREVIRIEEKVLGPLHPKRAQAISDLAAILYSAGKIDESLELQLEALSIWEKSLRPKHPSLANAYNRLAAAKLGQGKVDEAIGYFQKALAVFAANYGEDHPLTAQIHYNLGVLNLNLERYDQARKELERAAVGIEAAQGPASPKLGNIHYAICGVLRKQGRLEEGLASCQRSREIWKKAKGDHPLELARTLVAIGQAELGLKRPALAVEPLEQAVSLHTKAAAPELELQEARFELARALWDTRRNRKRALALGREAWSFFEKARDVDASQRAEMAAWIRARKQD